MNSPFPPRQRQLEKFVDRLGLEQASEVQWTLLDLALTHPSAHPTNNYEQLEFLGDSVIRLVSSRLLWFSQSQSKVGEWSAIRSVLVSDRTLAEIAQSIGLNQFLRVGSSAVGDRRGETSRLADSMEAVLGALFLSEPNLMLILPWLEPILTRYIHQIRLDPAYQNYKAELQQWTQEHYQLLPEYRVQAIASPHSHAARPNDPYFEAEVWLLGKRWGRGQGQSRKAAEKEAAQEAYLALKAQGAPMVN